MPELISAPIEAEQVESVLTTSTRDVLEAMFFTSPEGCPDGPSGTCAAVEVMFQGARRGRLWVVGEQNCARDLAANFSGASDPEDVSPSSVDQVLCELANMVCGATLSRLAPDAIFDLQAPQSVSPAFAHIRAIGRFVERSFFTGAGVLSIGLEWETQ